MDEDVLPALGAAAVGALIGRGTKGRQSSGDDDAGSVPPALRTAASGVRRAGGVAAATVIGAAGLVFRRTGEAAVTVGTAAGSTSRRIAAAARGSSEAAGATDQGGSSAPRSRATTSKKKGGTRSDTRASAS